MKVLIIYSSDAKGRVDALRDGIAEEFGKDTILRLSSATREKSVIPHVWHKDAVKMMKQADIIVYALSELSDANKNVQWEIRKARKLKKYIVCLPLEEGLKPTYEHLFETDAHTKKRECVAKMLHSEEELYDIIRNYENDEYIDLFHENMDPDVLMEQYKIFSKTAENLMDRRQNVNNFYITANTALITIGGTIFAIGSDGDLLSKLFVILALSLPGILLNISWFRMLQSYYINNQGKLKILRMIEKKLAVSLYDGEWRAMKNKYSKLKYVSFTDNEKTLPQVFSLFYGVIDGIVAVMIVYHLLQK